MRVIAGKKRGMKLSGFEGEAIRPTADRVKENMFNLIAPHVADAEVLDLFAGTGALSIEALSRGAAHAVLCEQARSSLGIIRKNVEKTGFLEQCSIVEGDCFGFLARNYKKFNLIFLDPPYNTGMLLKALRMIGRRELPGGRWGRGCGVRRAGAAGGDCRPDAYQRTPLRQDLYFDLYGRWKGISL